MDVVAFLGSLDVATIFLTSAISLVFLKIVQRAIRGPRKKLPPGPWRLPVIGSYHHVRGGPRHHRISDLAKQYGPVMMLKMGQTPTLVVSSPELAREIMKTQDANFAQRPDHPAAEVVLYGCSNITFSPVGAHWKLLRKMCALQLVNAKSIRKFQGLRDKEALSMIWELQEHARCSSEPVNLTDKIFRTIFDTVSKAAYGENYEARDHLFFISEKLMSRSSFEMGICDLFPKQKWLTKITGTKAKWESLVNVMDPILDKIISSTKVAPSGFIEGEADNLLSALLRVMEDGGLTISQVKAVMLDMIFGGTETSSSTADWALSELLRKPKLMKRAQDEVRQVVSDNKGCMNETTIESMKYLKAIVKETLRLHPPTPFLVPREAIRTCEVNGYTIPAGTEVHVNIWTIMRDPKYWSSPEEFLPDRFLNLNIDFKGFNFEYTPFGSGKRICPGMLLGVASVECMLTRLLYHFDLELPPGTTPETLDMTDTLGFTMKRKNPIIVIPRIPS
ncbi:hypothetical protein QN277_018444 [Acacia crassicarpa]|uniref:Cytochrome P450 n=1 Tax=Acacia crassicarpa TaxID=499986 RepID=A0AAE1KJF4_9FABA|nr:hypothetical protein QN277_018444 [Acacia crassicarpa]